ncbi:MAG: MAPEG family protein [Xanthobacteraceae bacterium]|nr:MAPEG family protein [Xanthobacteraceae bacterium]
MSIPAILAPLFVQVLLTFALMLGMMVLRGTALIRGKTRTESIAMRELNWPYRATLFANCFSNQFELPVLFYVLTTLAMVTKHADLLFVLLAWVFVAMRLLQALVHVTSNDVRFRGGFYGVGAIVLLVMWLIFIVKIMLGVP